MDTARTMRAFRSNGAGRKMCKMGNPAPGGGVHLTFSWAYFCRRQWGGCYFKYSRTKAPGFMAVKPFMVKSFVLQVMMRSTCLLRNAAKY